MPIPDNRLRFSSTKIDFANNVGIASQDHDNYPPPQGQARFDHMRMVVIALLSQQSSYQAPTEYRDGTPWFDLNSLTLKVRKGTEWVSYSEIIGLGLPDIDNNYKTLSVWYDEVQSALSAVAQEITYSGVCSANGINVIGIPQSLIPFIYPDSRAFVYVNGLMLDPRSCTLSNNNINLAGVLIDKGDEFTVIIRRIPSSTYYTPSITIP